LSEVRELEILKNAEVLEQKPCNCGHDYTSHMVSQIGEYTGWGWFWVLFGVTTEPVRVKFVCRRCNSIVGISNDPKILRRDV
jgi:hypothetical protein